MCDKIIQNPLARGQRGRGKGKRGTFRLARHIVLFKVAHRVNRKNLCLQSCKSTAGGSKAEGLRYTSVCEPILTPFLQDKTQTVL